MKRAYLSLGSNVGARQANIEEALRRLASGKLRVLRTSSVYETAPVERTSQPWYMNVVAECETSHFPVQLLNASQRVEREMGRHRLAPKGSRLIDIDILLFGMFVMDTGLLAIPHPRMTERRFVLEPMVELVPELRHPILRRSMIDLYAELRGQAVKRHAPPVQSL